MWIWPPLVFNPDLVTFDADNIYVTLNGSKCFMARTESPHECDNSGSPTGYNNRIKLTVEFADDPTNDEVIIDQATLNQLYDWLESKYPEYLPTHQDSFYIQGYYARYYQGTDVYIGSLGGSLYAYGDSVRWIARPRRAKSMGRENAKGNGTGNG